MCLGRLSAPLIGAVRQRRGAGRASGWAGLERGGGGRGGRVALCVEGTSGEGCVRVQMRGAARQRRAAGCGGGRGLGAGERSVKTLCRRVLVPWPHWALPGTLTRRTAYSYYTDAYTIGSIRGKLYNRPCYCSSCVIAPPGPAAARTCLTGIEEKSARVGLLTSSSFSYYCN